ncbi:transporter substrate-binding domain-containing protein [Streptomyces nanshensis]|uniref:transporter substrate-binding domain-containing protein n=1 Tax=Streptomyces nanshensis TaxID=518642 RepID=UPI0009A095D4|nr:transporter substrate-binding domain-containing protein [Streptomyces nanshensis]
MRLNSRRRLRRSALCVAALALALPATACDSQGDGDDSGKQSSSPSPSEESIFDSSVSVGVKKGQPGFNTKSGYDYAGFETALVQRLSDYTPFKDYDLGDLPSLQREKILRGGGKDLVVATYSITPRRDKEVDFTVPYFKSDQGLLVAKDEDRIKRLQDLKGKRVCTASGSTSDPGGADDDKAAKEVRQALGEGVEPLTRDDYKQCVQDLIKGGNFDAVWTDKIVLEGFAHAKPYADHVRVLPDITVGKRQYYGVGLREGHSEDCRKLNRALKEFLDKDWPTTFRSYFPELAEKQDFVQTYRPSPGEYADLERDSCGANDD